MLVFKLFFRFRAYGRENIPENGGFIIASNHESNLDPILIGAASPRSINFMAKAELFRNKFFGFILSKVNAFAVKRSKLDLGSLREALFRLKNKQGLLLFPQGQRRDELVMDEVKEGIGFLSSRAGVPIIPAFIKGSGAALGKGRSWPKLAAISVYFAEPIIPKSPKDYSGIAKEAVSSIKKLSDVYK